MTNEEYAAIVKSYLLDGASEARKDPKSFLVAYLVETEFLSLAVFLLKNILQDIKIDDTPFQSEDYYGYVNSMTTAQLSDFCDAFQHKKLKETMFICENISKE